MDISATIKLSPKMNQRPKSQQNNPAINAILQDMSMTNGDGNNTTAQRCVFTTSCPVNSFLKYLNKKKSIVFDMLNNASHDDF